MACPRMSGAILLAIGGWSRGDPTNAIEAYDIRADRWMNVTNEFEYARAYHSTAHLLRRQFQQVGVLQQRTQI